jgi:cytosine/adenosine deaminase-related metal-dependent hydrolase
MRIFIEPSYLGDSVDQSGRQAFELLREAGVSSARPGSNIDYYAVVLVDLPDAAKALEALGKAGMRAMLAAI